MNNELRELYQEVIIEHSRSPRHFHAMADCDCRAEGYNPLCGDRITVFIKKSGDHVKEISFQGSGCAISQASASLMTEAVIGQSMSTVGDLFSRFHSAMMTPLEQSISQYELGKLQVLAGVREFPMRIKCATLAWHALKNALSDEPHEVDSEDD